MALLLSNTKGRGNTLWVTCSIAAEIDRMKLCSEDGGCPEVRCDTMDGISVGLLTLHTSYCIIRGAFKL